MEDLIEETEEEEEPKRAPPVIGRVAMIPDTSVLSQVHLRPSADRTPPEFSPRGGEASPTMVHKVLDAASDSPPPPLPQRNR